MQQRSKYKTKQRETLLDYLASVSGEHVTAADICEHFSAAGTAIGKATVYRQLESLVDEGLLNKYVIDGTSPACFEYVAEENHAHGDVCFHCKCEKCGRLIHLHCDALAEIQSHLSADHSFQLNVHRTVFYGLCDRCRETGGKSI